MDKHTHNTIVRGLQQGDRQAWLMLYDAYAQRIWMNVARFMTYDSSAVADVVQETFLAAARSAGAYDGQRGSLWVWLWAIARRQIALYYRREQSRLRLEQARYWWGALDTSSIETLQQMGTPVQHLESEELGALVRHSLSRLPADYQVLLLAKYADDASVDQIAEQLQGTREAIRSKLARARKAFRRVFLQLTQVRPAVGRNPV